MSPAVDWTRVKDNAEPGDVLFLRRVPPEGQVGHCLVSAIHKLDGDGYDHVALVVARCGSDVAVAQATHSGVGLAMLDDLARHNWERAELRRMPPDGLPSSFASEVVGRAADRNWIRAPYAYGDLLLAGVVSAVDSADDSGEVRALRARVLALLIAMLAQESFRHSCGVTCVSFVTSCLSEDIGTFPTVQDRLDEISAGSAGGASPSELVRDLIGILHGSIAGDDLLVVIDDLLCGQRDVPVRPKLVTQLSFMFLEALQRLPSHLHVHAHTGGPDDHDDRPLIGIEDLHTRSKLERVLVEPEKSCRCETQRFTL